MPGETHDRRGADLEIGKLSDKLDVLLGAIGELKMSGALLAEQVGHNQRLQEQHNVFVQSAIERLQGEVDSERTEREAALQRYEDKQTQMRNLVLAAFAFPLLLLIIGFGIKTAVHA